MNSVRLTWSNKPSWWRASPGRGRPNRPATRSGRRKSPNRCSRIGPGVQFSTRTDRTPNHPSDKVRKTITTVLRGCRIGIAKSCSFQKNHQKNVSKKRKTPTGIAIVSVSINQQQKKKRQQETKNTWNWTNLVFRGRQLFFFNLYMSTDTWTGTVLAHFVVFLVRAVMPDCQIQGVPR